MDSAQGDSVQLIDPSALDDLEKQTRLVSESLQNVVRDLTKRMHEISAIAVAYSQTFDAAMKDVDAEADEAVKSMCNVIAHCEEMDKMMKPIHQMHFKIKNIKSLLPMLEARAGVTLYK